MKPSPTLLAALLAPSAAPPASAEEPKLVPFETELLEPLSVGTVVRVKTPNLQASRQCNRRALMTPEG